MPVPGIGLFLVVGTASSGLVEAERIGTGGSGEQKPVAPDLSDTARSAAQRRGKGDPLIRALGLKRGVERVLDTSTGLGRDALVAVAAGAEVTWVERHPVLDALLRDALARTSTDVRTRLVPAGEGAADARAFLHPHALGRFDAIYLDPMYAPADRTRGAAGRETTVLRRLLGDTAADPEADRALLDAARRTATRRVVVKRHPHAPALDGGASRPVAVVEGLSVRFDIYAPITAEG